MNRRHFFQSGAGFVLASKLGFQGRGSASTVPGGTLHPGSVPKYVAPLVIPPAMPPTSRALGLDYYEIAVRQFQQQVLPPGFGPTKVWSYGSKNHPATFNFPAFTIEARHNVPVRVKWINQLTDAAGNFLPHLLPVDPTLHWANPPGPRDGHSHFSATPGPYLGPVPIVTHVHGAHTAEESDGYPEAWYLPAGSVPPGYYRVGSKYEEFKQKFLAATGVNWDSGAATFQYPNDQRATTLWYHDHALGITRLNVYAGPAGFYLLRGGPEDLDNGALPGPAPAIGDVSDMRYYEIPIVIQDRSFNSDGTLFYPRSRAFFDGYGGPYIPATDVPPFWNPEFFGNMMVVNGRTWPYLTVEKRRYRFRFLNGCNSRFLILRMATNRPGKLPPRPSLPFWQIGAEGGFLPAAVALDELLIAPAERADVVVDFSNLPVGSEITLVNVGPDEPFGGGTPGVDFEPADPASTGQVMKFIVAPKHGPDRSVEPARLSLPDFRPLPAPSVTRTVSLSERMSMYFDGPVAALLGTVNASGAAVPKLWADGLTEFPALSATEHWDIRNDTEDAHPIHLHLVQFQVIHRRNSAGAIRMPEPGESGYKDTVIAYPDEVTRIRARFDKAGLFVWHCHILEHEDNEMMRPYRVVS